MIEEIAERIAERIVCLKNNFHTTTKDEVLYVLSAAVERGEIIVPKHKIGDEVFPMEHLHNSIPREPVEVRAYRGYNRGQLVYEVCGGRSGTAYYLESELYPTEAAAKAAQKGD